MCVLSCARLCLCAFCVLSCFKYKRSPHWSAMVGALVPSSLLPPVYTASAIDTTASSTVAATEVPMVLKFLLWPWLPIGRRLRRQQPALPLQKGPFPTLPLTTSTAEVGAEMKHRDWAILHCCGAATGNNLYGFCAPDMTERMRGYNGVEGKYTRTHENFCSFACV